MAGISPPAPPIHPGGDQVGIAAVNLASFVQNRATNLHCKKVKFGSLR